MDDVERAVMDRLDAELMLVRLAPAAATGLWAAHPCFHDLCSTASQAIGTTVTATAALASGSNAPQLAPESAGGQLSTQSALVDQLQLEEEVRFAALRHALPDEPLLQQAERLESTRMRAMQRKLELLGQGSVPVPFVVPPRRRRNLPPMATRVLSSWHQAHAEAPYPTEDEKIALAHDANITVDQVRNWFNNKRSRVGHSAQPPTATAATI